MCAGQRSFDCAACPAAGPSVSGQALLRQQAAKPKSGLSKGFLFKDVNVKTKTQL